MAFKCYACGCYVGNDKYDFETTDLDEAVMWCSEMFFEKFDDNRFVGDHCLYIDTEEGPSGFMFGFYRNGSLVVSDNGCDCFVFEDLNHGEKLVDVNDLAEWVMYIAGE